jgi:acyl-CoA reductase-like NAD-dependent aldehyde dehydrogenase
MVMQSVNPATEEVLMTFDDFSPQQVDDALQQAHEAFGRWRTASIAERAACIGALARVLRAGKNRWSMLITAEMGKTDHRGRG